MSDHHDGQSMRASVLAEEKEKPEGYIKEMKEKIEVLQRAVEEPKLRAEIEALQADVARGGGGGGAEK